ncbi:MAG: hypothetical protein ABSH24_20820 [Bryobacteraceae bacterium]
MFVSLGIPDVHATGRSLGAVPDRPSAIWSVGMSPGIPGTNRMLHEEAWSMTAPRQMTIGGHLRVD